MAENIGADIPAGITALQLETNAVIDRLATVADLSRQIYMMALTTNPNADLSRLCMGEAFAFSLLRDARGKVLRSAADMEHTLQELDTLIPAFRSQLTGSNSLERWDQLMFTLLGLAKALENYLH